MQKNTKTKQNKNLYGKIKQQEQTEKSYKKKEQQFGIGQ